ncbi:uncharacterized protein BDR25DRAFT_347082 [Lindgomyces ingoldianus]|uniref:Uncharacterized protein n=1 Tax=Lindgomyces ingoldianus TaxID=673940 RepID=A0ACB6Q9X5_9PLEO|nr:uncharacterized protein BDR25DRAFT_347082 [Lindgomyces ingoldianus]KAF2463758.1 hypothetical protein BDR25DRAFT_347082 [Lindgomyces ingoldianus]
MYWMSGHRCKLHRPDAIWSAVCRLSSPTGGRHKRRDFCWTACVLVYAAQDCVVLLLTSHTLAQPGTPSPRQKLASLCPGHSPRMTPTLRLQIASLPAIAQQYPAPSSHSPHPHTCTCRRISSHPICTALHRSAQLPARTRSLSNNWACTPIRNLVRPRHSLSNPMTHSRSAIRGGSRDSGTDFGGASDPPDTPLIASRISAAMHRVYVMN